MSTSEGEVQTSQQPMIQDKWGNAQMSEPLDFMGKLSRFWADQDMSV
jgi:hypothetical protein